MITSHQISESKIIVFREYSLVGYVGETHEWVTASQVDLDTNEITVMSYTDLKSVYRTIVGRYNRRAFWFAMNEMSPDSVRRSNDATANEAISRVI